MYAREITGHLTSEDVFKSLYGDMENNDILDYQEEGEFEFEDVDESENDDEEFPIDIFDFEDDVLDKNVQNDEQSFCEDDHQFMEQNKNDKRFKRKPEKVKLGGPAATTSDNLRRFLRNKIPVSTGVPTNGSESDQILSSFDKPSWDLIEWIQKLISDEFNTFKKSLSIKSMLSILIFVFFLFSTIIGTMKEIPTPFLVGLCSITFQLFTRMVRWLQEDRQKYKARKFYYQ